jgi:hypothetical protein
MAPPHTRGSTLNHGLSIGVITGSPAHAGIDLLNNGRDPFQLRLPRTRGDRPYTATTQPTVNEAPPHTRGST